MGSLVIVASDGHWRNQTGSVYAFDRRNGATVWRSPVDRGAPSDVVGRDSLVYLVSLGDELLCLNAFTGTVHWRMKSAWSFDQNAGADLISRPILADSAVIFSGRDSTIYAVDRLSGRLIWKHCSAAHISTTLLTADTSLIFGADDRRLTRLNRADGRIISEAELAAPPYGEIARRDNVLFLPSSADSAAGIARSLVAFDLVGKQTLWKAVVPDSVLASFTDMVRYDQQHELVLISGSNGYVFAFEPQTGKGRWTHRFDGTIRSLSIHDETMYVGTLSGRLFAFRLQK